MKKIQIIPILLIMLVGLAGIVYAKTCAFDQAATVVGTGSTYIVGSSQNLSVTITTEAGDGSSQNASKGIITSTGTITGTTTFNTTMGTNNTYINTTVNTGALADETAYTFTMTMYNETGNSIGTCTRVYYADNTIPVMSGTTPTTATTQTANKQQVFTASCENASTTTLWLDGVSYSMTESSDTCTYTKDYLSRGGHSWYVTGSDGLNTTTSTTLTLNIRDGSGLPPTQTGTSTGGDNNFMTLAIIIAIVWFVMSGGKKTRKRKR